MPLTAKGETIKAALTKEYGAEKGERVLYAGKNAGTFSGIDAATSAKLGALCDSIGSVALSVAKLTPKIDAYCDANSSAYEAAWNKFKAASQAWREAQRAYRAMEIDDAAFLAAKATFTAAQQEMDRATPPGH